MPFVKSEADKIKRFIETYCLQPADSNHGTAGQPMKLVQWEHDFTDQFFGVGDYINGKWKRQHKKGICFIPKKNGKSGYGAACAIHAATEVAGQDVIIVASSIKQSKIIYEACAAMVDAHPVLRKTYWTRDHIKEIRNKRNRSVIRVISSSPHGASGWNGCIICDEIAEWGPYATQVWEKLQSAFSSRWNGYLLSFSTANHTMGEHVGYQLFQRAEEVAKKPELDPLMLPMVYTCPEDQWDREEGWKAANPSYGTIIDPAEFRNDFESCKNDIRQQRRFKMFRLNIFQIGRRVLHRRRHLPASGSSVHRRELARQHRLRGPGPQ